ncbi:MAG: RNA polymerase sigma factor [Desulfobaccales bacterium]
MTDSHLVARAQQGDLQAFEELVRKYQREIFNLACRLVQDTEEAKDMAQQTFLQAYVHIRNFRHQSQFRTWLFRIAMNQCFNYLKTRKKFGDPMDSQEMTIASHDNPQDGVMDAEERHRLHAALERLPAKQRAVLTLKLEQGLSYEEISQQLGGTAGAARVNYCQAVKTLKKYLAGEENHDMALHSHSSKTASVSRR